MTSSPPAADRALAWLAGSGALVVAGVLAAVLVVLVAGAAPVLERLAAALTGSRWDPDAAVYGMAPMLAASVAVAALATAIAAPWGILCGVWLRLYAPAPLARALRAGAALMAGIPSVVYGLWGLMVLVPLVARIAPPGASLLTAALVLALMVLPFAVLLTDAALAQVPASLRQGAQALGLSRLGTFTGVLWPYCRHAIWRAVVLQVARALGETMAVVMVAGNVVGWPVALTGPVRTLTANIALELGYAHGAHRAALMLGGLVLLGATMALLAPTARRGLA